MISLKLSETLSNRDDFVLPVMIILNLIWTIVKEKERERGRDRKKRLYR